MLTCVKASEQQIGEGEKAACVLVQIVCCSLVCVVLGQHWKVGSLQHSTYPWFIIPVKWMLFSELGGSSLQHPSERHLSSAVLLAPAPGVEEIDTACLRSQRMSGAHQASLIVLWIAKALQGGFRANWKLFTLYAQEKASGLFKFLLLTGTENWPVLIAQLRSCIFEYGWWLLCMGMAHCPVTMTHQGSWSLLSSVFPGLVTTCSLSPAFSSLLRCGIFFLLCGHSQFLMPNS